MGKWTFYAPRRSDVKKGKKPWNKKMGRNQHIKSIATVLQSKYRCMKIVDGLEDWESNKQRELEEHLRRWTGVTPGYKNTLIISRRGFGTINPKTTLPSKASYDNPLFMAGRLIPKLAIRKPRHIDP